MNNNHIIIGYGNWGKKITAFLKKKNFFSKIYIKTRNKYFECDKKGKLLEKEFLNTENQLNSAHICTPVDSHFFYLNKFIHLNKIIVEKPFLKNLSQFNKIQKKFNKKNQLIVNYTYLFNPILINLKSKINEKTKAKIVINFSKKNKLYKKKYDCIHDWLDHPLSIILFLFKKFKKFKIIRMQFIKKKGFKEKLSMMYFYKNQTIEININNSKIDKKEITLEKNFKKKTYDLDKNLIFYQKKRIFFSNKNSFDSLYLALRYNKKLSFQNFNFHKQIMNEKVKILKKIKNERKSYK